jgi:hypothetical protein
VRVRNSTIVAWSAAALATVALSGGITNAQPGRQRGAAAPAVSYATSPLNQSSESLPRSYRGMDCVRAVAALRALPLTKSQFETTAAYTERIEQITSGTLYGSIKMTDSLVFKWEPGEYLQLRYDADRRVLSVRYDGSYQAAYFRTDADPTEQRLYEPLRVLQSATSTYIGSNAFGVRAQVRRVSRRVCAVLDAEREGDAAPWVDVDVSFEPGQLAFPMSVTDAQTYMKQPGLLLIGSLESPFQRSGGLDFTAPTRENPIERRITVDGVVMRLAAVWFYDLSSGRVFYRQLIARRS